MNRIIFPLDGMDLDTALRWVGSLKSRVAYFKVGLELFSTYGPSSVLTVLEHGGKIMLDLKLHDIPVTMRNTTKRAISLGASLLTVHAQAGEKALNLCQQAVEGRAAMKLVAVTVLTSLDSETLLNTYGARGNDFEDYSKYLVRRFVNQSLNVGVNHFVCSPLEAKLVRVLAPEATIICPGIRLGSERKDDQVRVDTPESAVENGADYLVIGRPIREAWNPERLVDDINESVEDVKSH